MTHPQTVIFVVHPNQLATDPGLQNLYVFFFVSRKKSETYIWALRYKPKNFLFCQKISTLLFLKRTNSSVMVKFVGKKKFESQFEIVLDSASRAKVLAKLANFEISCLLLQLKTLNKHHKKLNIDDIFVSLVKTRDFAVIACNIFCCECSSCCSRVSRISSSWLHGHGSLLNPKIDFF